MKDSSICMAVGGDTEGVRINGQKEEAGPGVPYITGKTKENDVFQGDYRRKIWTKRKDRDILPSPENLRSW